MHQNNVKKVIRLTESDLNHIIGMVLNEINESNNTITLYHCFDDEPKIENGIWLSDSPDETYGSETAEFVIPVNEFNIATDEQVIAYIKKYDIKTFEDANDDEYTSRWLDLMDGIGEAWDEWNETGKFSNSTELYEKIPYMSWAEVMEYPHGYKFLQKLKSDGFDGYMFKYHENMGYNTYYYFFDPRKVMQYRVN